MVCISSPIKSYIFLREPGDIIQYREMKFYEHHIKNPKEDTHHTSVLSSGILLPYNKQWQVFTFVCFLCSSALGEMFWVHPCLVILEGWLSVDFYQISWRNLYFLSSSIHTLTAEHCLTNNCNQISRISVAHMVCSADTIMVLIFKPWNKKKKKLFTCWRRHVAF